MYVFGMYLQVFWTYFVSILYALCQYMYTLHVFARINATSTFPCLEYDKYVQYVQILTRIRVYTYIKYEPNTYEYIRLYLHVCDGMCMYMTVYALFFDCRNLSRQICCTLLPVAMQWSLHVMPIWMAFLWWSSPIS